ncbi:MAG TPA: GNAT family N-acetyltransferase [Bacteroidales bacterium]|nr:GNAT family N-acetyltransferase [Bacteroidales bacterium]
MLHYRHLDWDSDFFGFKVASLFYSKPDVFLIKSSINKLKEKQYKLIYLIGPAEISEISSNQFFIPIDIKYNYTIDLADNLLHSVGELSTNVIPYHESGKKETMIKLALQSGDFSRFNIDKKFDVGKYEELYTTWIERSMRREIADEVLVYMNNSKILGFITLSALDGFGKIGLIAVDETERGKSIGRQLIYSSFQYFIKREIYKVFVATQGENINACTFYKKMGFILADKQYYYHIWL